MLYLLLKVASAVGMGLILKRTDKQGLARLPVIRINYAAAAGLAFLGCLAAGQQHISLPTALLAIFTGAIFVAGMLCWAQTIRTAGLALSVVAMRTAIVIPVIASILIWHEKPTAIQLIGVTTALVALSLVLSDTLHQTQPRDPNPGHGPKAPFWLASLFLIDGLVMVPAQIFRKGLPESETLPFQTVIFIAAFFITTIIYYLRRPRTNEQSLNWGALLGAANLGNYLFLVMALTVLPGVVVYPVIAAGEVGLLALAGVLVWKEKVGVRSWLGIGLAVCALILIQLGRTAN